MSLVFANRSAGLDCVKSVWTSNYHKSIPVLKTDFATMKRGHNIETDAGFVTDEQQKRLFAPYQLFRAEHTEKFDVPLPDLFVEVKSSTKWFGPRYKVWITPGEYQHAVHQLHENSIDTIYLFFDASSGRFNAGNMTHTVFKGFAMFSAIQAYVGPSNYRGFQFPQSLLSNSLSDLEHV